MLTPKSCPGPSSMKSDTKITPREINNEIDFNAFYNKFYPRFVKYASWYLNDRAAAEDITQTTLMEYWINRRKIDASTDVLGYLLTIVKNKCLNYLKHLSIADEYQRKRITLYDWEISARIHTLENTSYNDIFSHEIMSIVQRTLEDLPDQTRKIFNLNRFEDKPRKEIAKDLGVSQQTVDYHINKALEYLMEKLKDYIPLLFIFIIR